MFGIKIKPKGDVFYDKIGYAASGVENATRNRVALRISGRTHLEPNDAQNWAYVTKIICIHILRE